MLPPSDRNREKDLWGGEGALICLLAGSQQPASAFDSPAAAQKLLALHAAHLVVVVPCQLRASSYPPEKTGQETGISAAC